MEMETTELQQSDNKKKVYRLPLKFQLVYGIGHVLNDVCGSMWFTYLLIFFHLVLKFDNWQTGFFLLIGQIADATATPFVGYYSDRSGSFRFCRYGRRKVWHLLGTICVVGAFPFIFAPCLGCTDSKDWIRMLYYCTFIIIFQFGWASVQISHLSLIPELTPNEQDRTKLTAIRYSFTVISSLTVYILTWIILKLNDGEHSKLGPSDGPKFQHVVWSVLSVGIVCSFIFHLFIRESNDISNKERDGKSKTSMVDLFKNVRLYQIVVVYMATRLFVNLTQAFIPLYLDETLNMAASSLSLIPLIMYIGSFLASLLLDKLNRLLGRKRTYLLGSTVALLGCIWIQFGNGTNFVNYYIYLVAIFIGSGGSIVLITSVGVITDLIGDKTDSGAFIYALVSFVDKLANGIVVAVIQYYHEDDSNLYFYRNIITIVCGGSLILGCISVHL